jgi:hypothetical protein
MTMLTSNHQSKFGGLSQASSAYLKALHRGWVDRQNGRFWLGYETASYEEQLAYESGRLFLVNVLAARLPVPVWRGTRKDSDRFDQAIRIAHALVGSAVPAKWNSARPC